MRKWTAAILLLLLAGCSFSPEYRRPETTLPEAIKGQGVIRGEWWKGFGDERLNAFVEEALKNNDDIRLATARMEEAMARLSLARAELYPYLSNKVSISRKETGKDTTFKGERIEGFSLLGLLSYEVDLWGRLRNEREAALSYLLAAKAGRETVKISLTSTLISVYFDLIATERQIRTAKEMIERYREIYDFRRKQFEYGLIDELVVRQTEAEYEGTRVLLEGLKERKGLLKNTILFLTGREPKGLFERDLEVSPTLPDPLPIPSFIPSSVLEGRPDIVEAEERLKAANLEVGIARAAYFPSISLTGMLGLESNELRALFSPRGGTWTFGGDLLAPFIDFGRTKAGLKVAEAKKKEAIINYIKTVKNAFKEVSDALERLEGISKRIEAKRKELKVLEEVLRLAERKFDMGLVDYLVVLDSQRRYLQARLDLIGLESELLKDQVLLYKALGGGWRGKDLERP